MLTTKTILASSIVLLVGSLALSGCASPPPPPNVVEQQPVAEKPQEPNPATQPKEMPELTPAKPEEVHAAIARIFKGAVIVDASRKPSFLVGDFNGDLSQDLAVIIRPTEGKLSELNQEFPNWIAREPLSEVLPKSKLLAASSPPHNAAAGQTVRFEQRDVLLAIIHGSGPQGWRDPDATQTHLLRGVVGNDLRTLLQKDAIKAYNGIKPFPTIYGDLIQQTLLGQAGFLHYTGGIYGWYDPKNYKPVTATIPDHSMVSMSASSKTKLSSRVTRP